MSDQLEKSAERFIGVCELVIDGMTQVRGQLEKSLIDYRDGRAELDEALTDLNERRAKFIQESSETTAGETSQAIDNLAERIERLLAGGPFDPSGGRAAVAPKPVPIDLSEEASPQTINA